MASARNIRRVAITGMGAICGLGHSLQEVWGNALEGRSGISLLSGGVDTDNLAVKFGGQVKDFTLSPELIPVKEQSHYDRFIHLAIHGAHEALTMAGIERGGELPYPAHRIGSVLGVGMGGFPLIEENHSLYLNKGARRVSPFFIPSVIPNMAPGLISIAYGLRGTNYATTSACASSGHAMIASAMEIMLGRQDMMVTGGAESVFANCAISGFANMKALSKWNDRPTEASRPFDKDRNGFVMSEGAGIVILEDLEKAKARGATIYAEIVAYAATADAYHITAPHPEGEGAILCMTQALESAHINPNDIDYINAHGTSTPLGDIAETKAVKKVFKDHAYDLVMSSTKSMTGHLLGAAGGLESIFCVQSLYNNIVPPTINLVNPDPECDLNYAANKPIQREVNYAINNSFGFGGTNSTLIFKKYH